MKEKIRWYVAFLMIFVLLQPRVVFANDEGNKRGEDAVREKIEAIYQENQKFLNSENVKKNSKATDIYRKLINSIAENEVYPEYYGGAYINEENELVILVTELSKSKEIMMQKICGSSSIQIKEADVSFNYLLELQSNINETYEKRYQQIKEGIINLAADVQMLEDFSGSYIDEINNKLVVLIKNINDEKIEHFKKIFECDDNFVTFQHTTKTEDTAQPWKVGKTIWFEGSNYMSTGYRVYYMDPNGVRRNGFVTAAHGCDVGDYVYYVELFSSYYVLGQCKKSLHGDSVDVAFVEITNSTYEMTNTLNYSTNGTQSGILLTLAASSYASFSDVAVNTYIHKVGASTQITSGQVLSRSYSSTLNGKTISNLLKTDVYLEPGDSGGTAYIAKNGEYIAAGTVCRKETVDAPGNPLEYYGLFSQPRAEIPLLNVVKY